MSPVRRNRRPVPQNRSARYNAGNVPSLKNERFLYEKIDFSAFQEKTGAFRGIHGSFFGEYRALSPAAGGTKPRPGCRKRTGGKQPQRQVRKSCVKMTRPLPRSAAGPGHFYAGRKNAGTNAPAAFFCSQSVHFRPFLCYDRRQLGNLKFFEVPYRDSLKWRNV